MYAYNHTLHSGNRMRPANVDIYNAARARKTLSKRASANYRRRNVSTHDKFNVCDLVRISLTKNTFERGYEKNFSEEIFKITRVSYCQGLHTYILQDLIDEIIDGFFYKEELVRVGQERLASDKHFKIERVVRTKGRGANKQLLVKWAGYPDKFNSWVKASELKNISKKNKHGHVRKF